MSKSFRSKNQKRDFKEHDDEENYYSNQSSYLQRRQKRRLDNAIRSKNVSHLLELDDGDDYDDIRR